MKQNNQFSRIGADQLRVIQNATGSNPHLVLISHREFQAIFGISTMTSRRWRKKFQIPHILIGQAMYFRLSVIEALLEKHTVTLKRRCR